MDNLSVQLQPLVVYALNQNYGVGKSSIVLIKASSSAPSYLPAPKDDQFTFTIPFAGTTITWDVLFSHAYPEGSPDFIFCDKDFHPNISKLPTLKGWSMQKNSLYLTITELLSEYKHHAINKGYIVKPARRHLQQIVDSQYFDMEVRTLENKSVEVYLPVALDYARIPEYLIEKFHQAFCVVLKVILDGRPLVKCSIFSSESLKPVISHIKMPKYFDLNDKSLSVHYAEVIALISAEVDRLIHSAEKKKFLIGSLLHTFPQSISSFESYDFSRVSFVVSPTERLTNLFPNLHIFALIVEVTLDKNFPESLPSVELQFFTELDVLPGNDGSPHITEKKTMPYSPRWEPEEIIRRFGETMNEIILIIQQK